MALKYGISNVHPISYLHKHSSLFVKLCFSVPWTSSKWSQGFRQRIQCNGGLTHCTTALLSQLYSELYAWLNYSFKSHYTCVGKKNIYSLDTHSQRNIVCWSACAARKYEAILWWQLKLALNDAAFNAVCRLAPRFHEVMSDNRVLTTYSPSDVSLSIIECRSRDSSVDSDRLRAGRSGFDSRQGQEIFLFSTASRPPLGPTQPPIKWVPSSISPGLKRVGRETDHSPPSSAPVKNGGAIPPLSHTSSWRGA
jgi:hypothetical protein